MLGGGGGMDTEVFNKRSLSRKGRTNTIASKKRPFSATEGRRG
jgi:hypothetical protein